MDKTEKLALARKKLRKFQAKSETKSNELSRHSIVHMHVNVDQDVSDTQFDAENQLPPPLSPLSKHVKLSTDVSVVTDSKSETRSHTCTCMLQVKCAQLQEEITQLRNKLDESQLEKDRLKISLTEKNKLLATNSLIDNFNLDQCKLKINELEQENSEFLSRINQQKQKIISLEKTKAEFEKELSMYQLLSEQSSLSLSSLPNDEELKIVKTLQGEVAMLSSSVEFLKRERDQALKDVAALRDTMLQNTQENAREVGELQTQLKESKIHLSTLQQDLMAQHHHDVSLREVNIESLRAKDHALSVQKIEIESLLEKVQQLTSNNQMLSQIHSEAEERINYLQQQLHLAQDEVVNQQTFLSTVAEDKETLSDAVRQRKELEKNLRELENAFVIRTNQNAELADLLESESRKRRKFEEKCTNLSESLNTETNKVLELIEEINVLKSSWQSGDYQERENFLSESTQEVIVNSELTMMNKSVQKESFTSQNQPYLTESNQLSELSTECSNLKEERDRLLEELQHLSPSHTEQNQSSLELQKSFSALQDHYVAIMHDKAELKEKLQESEHRIIQLEGETETIGEYISLYQTQRDALKIKFLEKDRLIQQLLEDKAQLEFKLREVQGLARQLNTNEENKLPTSLPSQPSHMQTIPFSSHTHTDHIVSMIQELAMSGLDKHLHCPCCSGRLIIV